MFGVSYILIFGRYKSGEKDSRESYGEKSYYYSEDRRCGGGVTIGISKAQVGYFIEGNFLFKRYMFAVQFSWRECKHSDSLTQQLFRITHNFHEHFTNVPHSSTTKLQLTTPTTANNSISPLPTQSPQPQHPSITTSSPQTNGPHQPIFPPSAPYTKTTCTACPTYPHSLPH